MNLRSGASDSTSISHLNRLPELAISISQFDLRQEIRLLRKEESWQRGIGRSSRTLVKQQDFRIVLVLMKAKTRLTEHRANARISIQTIQGRIRVHVPNQSKVELTVAGLLALDSAIPYDIEALKEGQKAIQKDLQEIKTLLQRPAGPPPPPQNVVLDLEKKPFKGERKAKLTLVEFSDYQ